MQKPTLIFEKAVYVLHYRIYSKSHKWHELFPTYNNPEADDFENIETKHVENLY